MIRAAITVLLACLALPVVSADAQTKAELLRYALSVYAAEEGTTLRPSLTDYMGTNSRTTRLAGALGKVDRPPAYEKLHRSLVSGARAVARATRELGASPRGGSPGACPDNYGASCPTADWDLPADSQLRLTTAVNQYLRARLRLQRQLAADGVFLRDYPGSYPPGTRAE